MNGDDREDFNNFLRDLDERTSSILREDVIIQQTASIMRNDGILRRQINIQERQQRERQQQRQALLLLRQQQERQQQRRALSLLHQRMWQQQSGLKKFRDPSTMPNSVLQTVNLEHRQPSILNRASGAATMNKNANFAYMHQQQPRATPQLQNSFVAPSVAALPTKQRTGFPYVLYDMLNVNLYPHAVRWSNDGQAFCVDLDHQDFAVVLRDIFKFQSLSQWHNALKDHGWKKLTEGRYKDMIYHPHFRRNMSKTDFMVIMTYREEMMALRNHDVVKNTEETIRRALGNPAQKIIIEIDDETPEEPNPIPKAKVASKGIEIDATKPKASVPITIATKPVHKTKVVLPTADVTKPKASVPITIAPKPVHKRKVVLPTAGSQASSLKKTKRIGTPTTQERPKKKRKEMPSTLETSEQRRSEAINSPKLLQKKPPSSPTLQTNSPSKVVDSTDNKEVRSLKRRLREHKKLYNMLWKWDPWNFPKDLDRILETRKAKLETRRQKYFEKHPSKRPQPNDDPEAYLIKNMSGTVSDLLCDEELPECLANEEQDLADFVERIRKDKLKQDKFNEMWSKAVVPVVNGKTLPPEKFANPNQTWKMVKEGDKIGILWRGADLFYDATVQKQRRKTSYFHVIYDDGAEEWLDLSRETIKILTDVKKPTDRSPQRTPSSEQDRNALESISLPDNYSHLAPFVRYSWKRLGLGNRAGTPSYNAYIAERDPSAPKATVLDILNDVRALRSKGFSGISLGVDSENGSSDSDKDYKKQLRSLQYQIDKEKDVESSMKEFSKSLDAVRKLTDSWSARTVKANLQMIETQISKLNEREAMILEKCKQKGLC